MSLAGQQIGPYRLLKLIKHSNKSETYQAEDTSQSQPVVITIISLDAMFRIDAVAFKKAVAAFHQQAIRMMKLVHPCLNSLLSYGEETQGGVTYLYLVTAMIADGSLDDYLKRSNHLLAPEDVGHVIEQLADALQYVHAQGFVHGEIKPSYVAIKSCDSQHIYRICLDGLAVTCCVAAVYPTLAIRGTPTYLAPEQWRARSTTASDQYALATVAYKLLTGHTPFHGTLEQLKQQHYYAQPQPASLLNRQLPREIDTVLSRALEKDPRDRYRTISAFAQALLQAMQSNSIITINQSSLSRHKASAATLTETKANLILFLFCIGLFGVGASVVLNAYGLLPPLIAVLGSSLGGFIAFVATGWVVFEKLFPKDMWLKAKRWPVIIISLFIVAAVLAAAIYIPTLNPNIDPYIHQGDLAWSDSFTSNASGHQWSTEQTSTGSCQLVQGTYHARATSKLSRSPWSTFTCFSQNSEFTNFVYEAQMTFLSGDCGGIFFRANISMGNSYYFLICMDGKFDLQVFQQNKEQKSLDNGLVQADMHKFLLIAVVARNSNITTYINHQQVTTISDQTLLNRGHIGVGATYGNTSTEVAFSNVRVWSLDN